jgi:hypothetical protein
MSGGVDRDRLTKLMRMTESSADGEALNALRLANKMLREAGLHWGDVLGGSGTDRSHLVPPSKRGRGFNPKPSGAAYGRRAESQKYDGSRGRNTGDDIAMMLDALGRRRNSIDFQMFLGSVTQFWEKNGYLTDNQYAAILRSYEAAR